MKKNSLNTLGISLVLALTGGTAASAANPFKTHDDSMLEISKAVPGFGGMFVDEQGKLVVRLKNPTAAAAATRAIASVFGPERIPAEGIVPAPATYSFSTLKSLHGYITPMVLAQTGTVLTDVNEQSNRVTIGVESPEVRQRLERIIEALNVDPEMLEFVEMEPISPASTLRHAWRPITGGLQYEWYTGSAWTQCSIGIPAVNNANQVGFVGASHCTRIQGSVENTQAYQAVQSSSLLAGTEAADPPYFTSSTNSNCPSGRLCRYSDSAFFVGNTSVSPQIAQAAGGYSLTISAWLSVTGKNLNLAQGTLVHKTGRTTGTTSGTLSYVCATINSTTQHTFLCNHMASSSVKIVEGGDSGSPVYIPSGSNATVVGGVWGGSNTVFAFSPLVHIQNELGIRPYCAGNVPC